MTERFYVALDREGVQHHGGKEVEWQLPHDGQSPTTSSTDGLALLRATELMDELEEFIFVGEPIGPTQTDNDGATIAQEAKLVDTTNWSVVSSAIFALDCADHVTSEIRDVRLPDGFTISAVLTDARQVLREASNDAEHRLGRLARLSAVRRLRRKGDALSDVARELMSDDIVHDIDALDDPDYAAIAAAVDALLGAVESVRHLALPRYVDAREYTSDTHSDAEPASNVTVITTPWGPIAFGAEHRNAYAPSWVAARDAAARARDAAATRDPSSEVDERSWQAQRLEEILNAR